MKSLVKKSIIILVSLGLSTALWAAKDSTTLTIHHFLSPKSPAHAKFIAPWAKQLEKASKGKIKVEIFPSMSMGGKPNELYKQVRDGSADIVWTVAGYTPGVFPRTEVYELPTVHKGDSLATTLAIKKNFNLIKDDYKDVIPLFIHVHAGNVIHTTEKKIMKISDLKGLKLRTPSRTGGWLISELGAEPVGMPLPAFPQALSKKAIDGGLIPFEVFPPFKFHQLTRYSAFGKNGDRFGTSVFLFLMNKDKYKSLSKKLQNIIMKNSDLNYHKKVGQIWMDIEKPGIKMQKNSKNSQVVRLDNATMSKFNKVGQRVVNRWIKEVGKKNINGKKLVAAARKAIANN